METSISSETMLLVAALALWTLPFKGWAMWLAARRGEKGWFVVFLVTHTLAILEIIYILLIAKRRARKETPGRSSM